MTITSSSPPTIGILALQGAFREHANHLESLSSIPLKTLLVRTPSDLLECQALIIPGGESTAICLGAQRAGLLGPLRKWVRDGNPTWGTCAGMILLSQQATGGKKGGQELIGGVDVRVGRNGWGSQVSIRLMDRRWRGERMRDGSSQVGVFFPRSSWEVVQLFGRLENKADSKRKFVFLGN